jgi:thymidylate synthase (FAD)
MKYPIPKRERVTYPTVSVLDHGEMQLMDFMGDDLAIVEAARVSVKEAKKVSDDETLLRYLMRHRHWTPYEMVEIKVRMKMPIFVARQFIRHRTANVNEISARYAPLPTEFYVPKAEDINWQAPKNKQGRSDKGPEPALAEKMQEAWTKMSENAFYHYSLLLGQTIEDNDGWSCEEAQTIADNDGVARELARINLPLSTYTEWIWKCDLRNIFNFLSLRKDGHAQKEIRVYADVMGDIVESLCPLAYNAFNDYIFNAISFSAPEIKVLRAMMDRVEYPRGLEPMTAKLHGEGLSQREVAELAAKIQRVMNIEPEQKL